MKKPKVWLWKGWTWKKIVEENLVQLWYNFGTTKIHPKLLWVKKIICDCNQNHNHNDHTNVTKSEEKMFDKNKLVHRGGGKVASMMYFRLPSQIFLLAQECPQHFYNFLISSPHKQLHIGDHFCGKNRRFQIYF